MLSRRSLLLLSLSFSLTGLIGTTAFAQSTYQRDFKKTVPLASGGTVSLDSDKGTVRITAWDQNSVDISARINPSKDRDIDQDYGQRTVDGVQIEVTGDANTVRVHTNFEGVPERSERWGSSRTLPDVHYEIRVPRQANVNVQIDRSHVTLTGLNGKVFVRSDRTPVEGSDLAGEIRLDMDRGQATISGVRGKLEVRTDRTNLQLSAASIEGDSRFAISRGELDLRIPSSQGATINAGVGRRENFESDFPLTMNTLRSQTIEGTINGGGPRLTFEGDRNQIRLRKQ
jgi:hypothetical protein